MNSTEPTWTGALLAIEPWHTGKGAGPVHNHRTDVLHLLQRVSFRVAHVNGAGPSSL